MCSTYVLVQTALPGKHSTTLVTAGLLVHPPVTLVHTLDMLGQMRRASEHLLTHAALEGLLPLDPIVQVAMHHLDVVPEVCGVAADSATGVTAAVLGGGRGGGGGGGAGRVGGGVAPLPF